MRRYNKLFYQYLLKQQQASDDTSTSTATATATTPTKTTSPEIQNSNDALYILSQGFETRAILMRCNARLVVSIAANYAARGGSSVNTPSSSKGGKSSTTISSPGWSSPSSGNGYMKPTMDELIQEGFIGLVRAVVSFILLLLPLPILLLITITITITIITIMLLIITIITSNNNNNITTINSKIITITIITIITTSNNNSKHHSYVK